MKKCIAMFTLIVIIITYMSACSQEGQGDFNKYQDYEVIDGEHLIPVDFYTWSFDPEEIINSNGFVVKLRALDEFAEAEQVSYLMHYTTLIKVEILEVYLSGKKAGTVPLGKKEYVWVDLLFYTKGKELYKGQDQFLIPGVEYLMYLYPGKYHYHSYPSRYEGLHVFGYKRNAFIPLTISHDEQKRICELNNFGYYYYDYAAAKNNTETYDWMLNVMKEYEEFYNKYTK